MKTLVKIILLTCLFFVPTQLLEATSEKAYQDYLYQFDQYRAKDNDFKIARNEYLKFKSLSSETLLIEKTRLMLEQRSLLLRAYLLLLQERISETTTLPDQDRAFYTQSINNENVFLEDHSQFVGSVQNLTDAIRANKQLEDRYLILQTTIRQTILGLNAARLRALSEQFAAQIVNAQALVDQVKPELAIEKQATLDRWMGQITNKKTLYTQKQDLITQAISSLKGNKIQDLDKNFNDTQKKLTEAHQELKEASGYLNELLGVIRYVN